MWEVAYDTIQVNLISTAQKMAEDLADMREPAEDEDVKEVNDLKMSRTEEPDYSVDFQKIRDTFVYDGMGNKIKFGDIYKMQKTIVVFVRVNKLMLILLMLIYLDNTFL